jgi:hypothetical protein
MLLLLPSGRRRKNAVLLLHLNILFFPVVFVFLVLASAASAPLLALFSLPIFILTYPRPSRFWPNLSGKQEDFDTWIMVLGSLKISRYTVIKSKS